MRMLIARLLAVGLGSLAAFGAAEALARTRLPRPLPEREPLLRVQANPLRGWEMVPGEDHYTYHHRVSINALGLRGPEVEAKGDGELRVLAVGDSLVYGQGVADDETLPAQLEVQLEERLGRPVTVVNGGLRAYSTPQELGLLEELGPAIDPDLVLLFWYWNDLDWIEPGPYAEKLERTGPIAFDLRAAPEGLAIQKWRLKQVLRKSALLMALHDSVRDSVDVPDWYDQKDARLAELPVQLEAFKGLSADLGADFVPFAIPKSSTLLGGSELAVEVLGHALEVTAEAGIELTVLDTQLKAIAGARGGPPIVPFDGHYDVAGNRALALEATDHLVELGLIGSDGAE
ncbi:MAG: SGNH/GDSL hydrolase family protein [Planctomycetota bacterium]